MPDAVVGLFPELISLLDGQLALGGASIMLAGKMTLIRQQSEVAFSPLIDNKLAQHPNLSVPLRPDRVVLAPDVCYQLQQPSTLYSMHRIQVD